MPKIRNDRYTIEEAFGECFYVVPDYQREYVWTEKQVTQLLEDINEHINARSPEYFIGITIVSPRKEKKHFSVIDGQQRLTTIFLILCALRDLFRGMRHEEMITGLITRNYTGGSKGYIKTSLKLKPQYENAGEVMEKIVQTNGNPKAVEVTIQDAKISVDGSVKKILHAYDVIYRFLADTYDSKDKLIKYWGHLASNVNFIQISAPVSSALKIFETINERGIGLNPMDLLKNLLFTQVPQKQFSQLKQEWKKITEPLEKNQESPLRFLRYFLMANYPIENDRNDAIIREDQIYDWFLKEKNINATGYKEHPFDFVAQIVRNVDRYINFSKDRGNDGEPNSAIYSLQKLTGPNFSAHYVLLLAAADLEQSLFDQFVAQLESLFFYYIFSKKRVSSFTDQIFPRWAGRVRKISQIKNEEEQRNELNKFIKGHFNKYMDDNTQKLNSMLEDWRPSSTPTQNHRVRYFLARLTQHVDMAFSGQKPLGNLEYYFNLHIEHILPKNPKEDLQATWKEEHPELPYEEIKDRLGNLTLLESPINIVASNDYYQKKIKHYEESRNYLTRSLAKHADIGKNTSISRINEWLPPPSDKWDVEEIEKRQEFLSRLAFDIWKITEIK